MWLLFDFDFAVIDIDFVVIDLDVVIDEDFNFKYTEFQTLEFNENSSISNLTSVLAYYAYIIIGLDFYTFSLEGGASYLQKAKDIVNNSQNKIEEKHFFETKRVPLDQR